jgi:hypothetical protein
VFPPVQLVDRVLQHLSTEGAEALRVVPYWPGQAGWGLLHPIARMSYELGKAEEVLISGPLMTQSPSQKILPPGLLVMVWISPDNQSTGL